MQGIVVFWQITSDGLGLKEVAVKGIDTVDCCPPPWGPEKL